MAKEMSTHQEFRDSLAKQREILRLYCDSWNELLNKGQVTSDSVIELARSAVGKASLLLRKKLSHFEELIEQAENKTSVKDISINDLLGYWEMMESQINEVKGLFEDIETYRTEKNTANEASLATET